MTSVMGGPPWADAVAIVATATAADKMERSIENPLCSSTAAIIGESRRPGKIARSMERAFGEWAGGKGTAAPARDPTSSGIERDPHSDGEGDRGDVGMGNQLAWIVSLQPVQPL